MLHWYMSLVEELLLFFLTAPFKRNPLSDVVIQLVVYIFFFLFDVIKVPKYGSVCPSYYYLIIESNSLSFCVLSA